MATVTWCAPVSLLKATWKLPAANLYLYRTGIPAYVPGFFEALAKWGTKPWRSWVTRRRCYHRDAYQPARLCRMVLNSVIWTHTSGWPVKSGRKQPFSAWTKKLVLNYKTYLYGLINNLQWTNNKGTVKFSMQKKDSVLSNTTTQTKKPLFISAGWMALPLKEGTPLSLIYRKERNECSERKKYRITASLKN